MHAQGWLNETSGEAELAFDARFTFSSGGLYKAPPLRVTTPLTTERVAGRHKTTAGVRLRSTTAAGARRGRFVGVAQVPRTGDALLDVFLQLPNDAVAELDVELGPC